MPAAVWPTGAVSGSGPPSRNRPGVPRQLPLPQGKTTFGARVVGVDMPRPRSSSMTTMTHRETSVVRLELTQCHHRTGTGIRNAEECTDDRDYPLHMSTLNKNVRTSHETSDLSRVQLDFPPILNGIDYLASVVDLLLADPLGPRELKYAVIHLNAAAEVLLKARLQDEHWSLVFDDPRKATRRAFASGTFTSCTMADAVTRLRDTAQVALTDDEQNALKRLGQDRNALQHYGLTHSARAVESRTGQALDFLLRFLKEELLSGDREEAGLNDEVPWNLVRDISVRARDISSYRTERRKRLRGVLRDVARHTLTCHECGELALVIGDRCHFCNFPIGGFPRSTWPTWC